MNELTLVVLGFIQIAVGSVLWLVNHRVVVTAVDGGSIGVYVLN